MTWRLRLNLKLVCLVFLVVEFGFRGHSLPRPVFYDLGPGVRRGERIFNVLSLELMDHERPRQAGDKA